MCFRFPRKGIIFKLNDKSSEIFVKLALISNSNYEIKIKLISF